MSTTQSAPRVDRPAWGALLAGADGPASVDVLRVVRVIESRNAPALVETACGPYWLKDSAAGRETISEQIAGSIGVALRAPVARTVLLDVPDSITADLRARAHPDTPRGRIAPGLHHGSANVAGCEDQAEKYQYRRAGVPSSLWAQHPGACALLSVFFSLLGGGERGGELFGDPQLLITPDGRPVSADHGFCFSGARWAHELAWTPATLAEAPPAVMESSVWPLLPTAERTRALAALASLTPAHIARAVAAPHDAWGITTAERIAAADYLWRRRRDLLTASEGGTTAHR